jgi:CRISPR-associated protein Cas5t
MLSLQITAPFATFTNSRSREYAASFKYPSPATIYGLLLSLIGEVDRTRHLGVKIAIGILSEPKSTVLLRTFKRAKDKDINSPVNSRPDYQEVLCGLNLIICVDSSEDKNLLENRILETLNHPEKTERFGGLSLGESRDLVNDLRIIEQLPVSTDWLIRNPKGEALPVWVDYQGSENTRWETFTLGSFHQDAFCIIQAN